MSRQSELVQQTQRIGAGYFDVDASGRVLMPNQPAFLAHGGFTVSSLVATNWAATRYNVGSHFNATTGVFTAPVAGMYLFSAGMLSTPSASLYCLWNVAKNGAAYFNNWVQSYTYGSANDNFTSATITMEMSANDAASVIFNASHANPYTPGYNFFSGRLIG